MVKSEREYRAIVTPLEVRNADGEEKSCKVRGYATTFDDPYVLYDDGETKIFEQIDKKAFDGADMSDVLFLYNHEGRVFARVKNGSLKCTVDEHGLYVEADLGLTDESRKMYDDIKAGLVDQMSWAFTVDAEEYDKKTKTRTIKSVRKVYDVSAVSIPANPNTELSARSFCDGVIAEEQAERLERQAALELAKAKYKYLEA